MKQNGDQFSVEATPVVEIKRPAASHNTGFENEKTEVYLEEEGGGSAFLVDSNGEYHPITAFPFVMGRGNECDLVLNGKGISRKHAEIVFQSGRFVVNDLDSLNGLKVNGYKVARVILEENDAIKLGDANLVFTTSRDSGAGQPAGDSGGDSERITAEYAGGAAATLAAAGQLVPRNKKAMVFALGGGAVLMAAVAAFVGMGGNHPSAGTAVSAPVAAEEHAVAGADAAPVPTTDQATVQPGSQDSGAPSRSDVYSGSTNRVLGTEPPPSIGLAPPADESTVAAAMPPPVRKPAPPKPERVVAPKPAPSSPAVQAAPVVAKAPVAIPDDGPVKAVSSAMSGTEDDRYLRGDADAVLADLQRQAGGGSPSAKSAAAKRDQLLRMYNQYMAGKQALAEGNKAKATEIWTAFLEAEKSVFGSKRSVYGKQVAGRLMEDYVSQGNEAAKSNRNHEAYQAWEKALTYGDSVPARIAIDAVNQKSKQLYRQALRLEYVNTERAKELWQQVTELVPPGTEYYSKASAKLAWYEKWGT